MIKQKVKQIAGIVAIVGALWAGEHLVRVRNDYLVAREQAKINRYLESIGSDEKIEVRYSSPPGDFPGTTTSGPYPTKWMVEQEYNWEIERKRHGI